MNQESAHSDRRHVPARDLGWSKSLARLLAQANVSANAISLAGVVAAALAAGALAATRQASGIPQHIFWVAAGLLVGTRLLCNMLDGMVAVEWGKASPVGALYNEIPDRVADLLILGGAGFSAGGHELLGYAAAFTAVFTAYIRVAARSVGAPSDFGGPMAKPMRMAIVIACCAYLGFTPDDWHPRFGAAGYGLMALALAIIALGSVVTCIVRVRHAAQYLNANA
ncbi:CDP-alcohol phosphatidyltransferase family protein [Methylomonas rosea]|uniref:CDP-alcohol phosphatidyltransferase family protein n=1 Tax=Methylomonas rosea TaxID=2952227 RepID=A0ABT1TT99_9GAMM|nr:CDP-alcohol phosphatidyltransferase family protein [Methylomonas sp. WSC-7]MCQ8117997.1 CDP-alcohol phosphatidyltransferase family protein [Methylomonas sp. WSC-7]